MVHQELKKVIEKFSLTVLSKFLLVFTLYEQTLH